MSNATPGQGAIVWIVCATFAVSVIITLVTGEVRHWLPVVMGVVVGLWAVQAVNK